MSKLFRRLEVEKITFSANTLKTREMPLTVYRYIDFLIKITHTNGASPSITAETFSKIISKLNLVINGQDTIVSIPMYFLYFSNMLDYSIEPSKVIDTTASTQVTSKLWLRLPIALLRAVVPEDTLLDARKFSTLNLEIQWGSSIGTGVTSVDSGELQIYTGEYLNVPIDRKFARHERGYSQQSLTATGTGQPMKLEVGSNNQYRRLWIFAFDNNGDRSDSQIDMIGLKTRSFYHFNLPAEEIQRSNVTDFAYALQTGLYVLDLTSHGKMNERIDARNLSELLLEVNSLVSNGTIEVIKEKPIYA